MPETELRKILLKADPTCNVARLEPAIQAVIRKYRLKAILSALDTDTQKLADDIGEKRPIVSGIISDTRKATSARTKLANEINKRVAELILPKSEPENAV